ncbi:Uncharacterised protein [uncultured archaeon]|nr:Uncharacterised protein [uncultured archaeon]
MNVCPHPSLSASFSACLVSSSSLPSLRTSRFPDASQKASPNFNPGELSASVSYKSSTLFMKWVWPKITFPASGSATSMDLSSTIQATGLCLFKSIGP